LLRIVGHAIWILGLLFWYRRRNQGSVKKIFFIGLHHLLQPESGRVSHLCFFSMNVIFSEMTIADESRQPTAKSYTAKKMSRMTGS
jgi:hypothetical protein